MITGKYLIAEHVIEITSIYNEVHEMCAPYKADETAQPEIFVSTTAQEIEEESATSDRTRESEGLPPYKFPDSYIETLVVYRSIATQMIRHDVILFHGSAIAVDGVTYLFTARSGTGKSTHVRLWRELFKERAIMVNDDKPLLHISPSGETTIYGTPWDGKHHLSSNIALPLKAICVLERGKENEIEEITAQEAFPHMMQQCYRHPDAASTIKLITLLSSMAKSVKFYRLHCNMHPDAARISYKAMSK